jgi:triphosphatase
LIPATPGPGTVAIETELKLAIAPEHVARLARSAVLRDASHTRPATRRTHSVYFDTPDHALRLAGMALRLRRDGRRWIQTLKTAGRVEAGLHARDEFEVVRARAQLDFATLADTPLGPALDDARFRAALAPVFETDFRRSARLVTLSPDSIAELVLDRGEVIAGDRREPICEVEIELRSGSAADLFAFAARLVQDVPLRLASVSKAARGYALLAPDARPAASVKAVPFVIDPDATLPDTFATLVHHCVAHLQANENGLLEASPDIEYVHQARVALRRLRSAFRLFRDIVPTAAVAPVVDRVRALAQHLGETRDWDVFLSETLAAVEDAIPGDETLAGLHAQAASMRRAARDATAATVNDPEWTVLLLDLAGLVATMPWREGLDDAARALEAQTPRAFAAAVLAKQAKRVRRHGRDLAALDPVALHALRIEIKKLRYATEFFQSLFARKAVRTWIDATAVLQSLLGTLNDAAVTQRLLGRLDGGEADSARACGLVRGFTAARADGVLGQVAPAWARFRDAKPFW